MRFVLFCLLHPISWIARGGTAWTVRVFVASEKRSWTSYLSGGSTSSWSSWKVTLNMILRRSIVMCPVQSKLVTASEELEAVPEKAERQMECIISVILHESNVVAARDSERSVNKSSTETIPTFQPIMMSKGENSADLCEAESKCSCFAAKSPRMFYR